MMIEDFYDEIKNENPNLRNAEKIQCASKTQKISYFLLFGTTIWRVEKFFK